MAGRVSVGAVPHAASLVYFVVRETINKPTPFAFTKGQMPALLPSVGAVGRGMLW